MDPTWCNNLGAGGAFDGYSEPVLGAFLLIFLVIFWDTYVFVPFRMACHEADAVPTSSPRRGAIDILRNYLFPLSLMGCQAVSYRYTPYRNQPSFLNLSIAVGCQIESTILGPWLVVPTFRVGLISRFRCVERALATGIKDPSRAGRPFGSW